MKNKLSFLAFLVSVLFMFYLTFFFYPKWDNKGTEATISWDVSGYYMYLPAIFIYHDLEGFTFKDKILEEYGPTPDFQQGLKIENGNYVMKYPIGQAILFSPYFFIANWYALHSDKYKADGFSKPYQFMITIESYLFAILGLWFLRLILLRYFKDSIISITILGIVFGSNYLDYSTMAGAMTHNHLFTLYALLIYFVIRFYNNPKYIYAIFIGALVGLSTITRPTELISFFIPLLWGIKPNKASFKERVVFFKLNYKYLISAVVTTITIGSIQLFYWKYVSGDWLVYSYDDQGFKFLQPHFWLGIFSYRSGWLVYSPMMLFPLIGFYFLYKNYKSIFIGLFVFFLLFIYLAFAWNIWWYGGSLGIRAMVQSYVVLAFPFAAFIENVLKKKYIKYIFWFLFIVFSYYNVWLTYQAHKGGLLHPGMMTKAYFWKTLGRYDKVENDLKLLDTKEEFIGTRKNVKVVFQSNFENDTLVYTCDLPPIQGRRSLCLDSDHQNSDLYVIDGEGTNGKWVRASADFFTPWKEWNDWKMAQFIIGFYDNNGAKIKERMIRINRFLNNGQTRNIYIDTKIPDEKFKNIGVKFWNASGDKQILIDNLKLEIYDAEN